MSIREASISERRRRTQSEVRPCRALTTSLVSAAAKTTRLSSSAPRQELALVVLPVRGAGCQSTIRAYLALEADLGTVAAFTVYEQGETPGLGARVTEDGWQAQWAGKRIFDDGDFAISVVRGNASGPNEVDGISGASVTSYAISDMLEFWMGEHGFGPFLDRLKKGEIE